MVNKSGIILKYLRFRELTALPNLYQLGLPMSWRYGSMSYVSYIRCEKLPKLTLGRQKLFEAVKSDKSCQVSQTCLKIARH